MEFSHSLFDVLANMKVFDSEAEEETKLWLKMFDVVSCKYKRFVYSDKINNDYYLKKV